MGRRKSKRPKQAHIKEVCYGSWRFPGRSPTQAGSSYCLQLSAKLTKPSSRTVCKPLPPTDRTYKRHLSAAFVLNPVEIPPNWLRKGCVCGQLGLWVDRGEEAGRLPPASGWPCPEAAPILAISQPPHTLMPIPGLNWPTKGQSPSPPFTFSMQQHLECS